jgi:inorganic triphosphatase YgiF
MTEIELKFQVPQERRAALAKAVGTATARNVRLQAQYFDTADRRLAQALLALRVRKEGRRWVQTLKGAGDGLWQRVEHEVPVTVASGQSPLADPALHDGTSAGEALRTALGDAGLVPTYGSDVRRCLRLLRAPGCTVELAFDQGALQAGGERWPLCELEFELKAGDALAMTQVAARWVGRFGLTLDTRSKSERGDRLARGVRLGAPVKAQPVQLAADVDSAAAVRSIVGSCLGQVLGNASDIAHGEYSPEHLHQLRVGLRRLRTALRELADLLPSAQPQWNDALTQVFSRLGAARDFDALAQTLLPALRKAGASALQLPADGSAAPPEAVLREPATQLLWLELLACAAGTGGSTSAEPEPIAPRLQERLARLRHQVRRDAKLFASIDDTARHRLRKRIKRLRYLCDFAASLHEKKAVKAFVAPLAAAQEALGAFNDVCVARTLFDRVAADDSKAMFALGWLAHERDGAIERCVSALRKLRKAPVFW